MSVRRAGLVSVTGDKREEVERKVGRNKALPERKDMVGVWIGSSGPDLPAQQSIRLVGYAVMTDFGYLHYNPPWILESAEVTDEPVQYVKASGYGRPCTVL